MNYSTISFNKKLLLIPLVILFVSTGCKKEPVINSAPSRVLPQPPPPPPLIPGYIGPKAFAGFDKWVPLPANFSVVYGYTSHEASTIESYVWKKISGPASYLIENPGSKETKITNLEKGTYEFEFTVTTKAGLLDKATVSIHVYEPRIAAAKNEFIFKNLEWSCGIGCNVNIGNFNLYVPSGTALKVFLKSPISTNWIEILNNISDKYNYSIQNNRFFITADYPDDSIVDVKITF